MAQSFNILPENPKRAQVRELAAQTVAALNLDGRWKVLITEPDKSREQEEKYHAMINDIARTMVEQDGRVNAESWKRLLVDQFKADCLADPTIDKKIREYFLSNPINMRPSLDGQRVVVLGEQTRKFPKSVATAFITWLEAFGSEHDVTWTETWSRA